MHADIAAGMRFLWSHHLLRNLAVAAGVVNLGGNAFFVVSTHSNQVIRRFSTRTVGIRGFSQRIPCACCSLSVSINGMNNFRPTLCLRRSRLSTIGSSQSLPRTVGWAGRNSLGVAV